jgi:indole-3-glycerol phosphate synthase
VFDGGRRAAGAVVDAVVGNQERDGVLRERGAGGLSVLVAVVVHARGHPHERLHRHRLAVRNPADGFEDGALVRGNGEPDVHVVEVVFSAVQVGLDTVEHGVLAAAVGGRGVRERDADDALARDANLDVALEGRRLAGVDAGVFHGFHQARPTLVRSARDASLLYRVVHQCTTMDETADLAPTVRSILDAARERDAPDGRVAVTPRSLPDALADAEADGRLPTIAEVKPTSPTTEGTRETEPAELAEAMVAGGAAAISVLTEPEHFGGSPEALTAVREAVDVPVLRKDFLLREAHLDAVEADVVLLIARFLGDDLPAMLAAARERGFQALVEVHTERELRQAVEAGADVVGVNNRDLAELEVDLETFETLAPHAPDDVTLLAESGVSGPADARRMREAGADGLLVGSAIMDGDVTETTRRLVNA